VELKMDLLGAIIVGLISSFTASFIFLFYLKQLRPKLRISPYIAKETYDGDPIYVFKVINYGSRDLVDIKLDVELAQLVNVEGGLIYKSKNIPLVKNYLFQLSKFDKSDTHGNYAARFTTKVDINSIWESENDYLILKVIATDSFSGFSDSFSYSFRVKRTSIKEGSHKWGPELEVV
jgi:hypothetical protein